MKARIRSLLLPVAAVLGPIAVAAALVPTRSETGNANIALLLLGLVAATAVTGRRLAAVLSAVSAVLAYDILYVPPYGAIAIRNADELVSNLILLAAGLIVGELAVRSRRNRREADRERALRELSEQHEAKVTALVGSLTERQTQVETLAEEQAALRRVATLVAGGVPEEQLFAAVAEEVCRLAGADTVQMCRYEPDASVVRLAAWGRAAESLPIGARYATGGNNVTTMVLHSGRPARIDDATTLTGEVAAMVRPLGFRSLVGNPIVVAGRLWGLVVVGTTSAIPLAADTERRIAGFTELVATAIANAQAHLDLAASRQRVVAAADLMRRRMERDLHDGTQQRLVAATLQLRTVQDSIRGRLPDVECELARVEDGLSGVLGELREISRGLHPAILSEAGLGPALKSLARRAVLPVELDVAVPGRLPESVEVAAYYVVSEALANAAKHSNAARAQVELATHDRMLRVRIHDDGAGGADPSCGSGLVGLRDRVEALGGSIVLSSPPGQGTWVLVELPVGPSPRGGAPPTAASPE
jgi:signal transduction histidine kinase